MIPHFPFLFILLLSSCGLFHPKEELVWSKDEVGPDVDCHPATGPLRTLSGDTVTFDFDELPMFTAESPHFDREHLNEWIRKEMRYPKTALRDRVEGRVVVKYIIDKEGNVVEPAIVRGVRSDLNEEALRIVGSMPRWRPAHKAGLPVATLFALPIIFTLPDPLP